VHFVGQGLPVPADYTFTPADAGRHTFSVTATAAGSGTIRVADTANPTYASSVVHSVGSGAMSGFAVTGFPSPIISGSGGNFVIRAQDAYANPVSTYTGTVHISSSDPAASLQEDYTFDGSEQGWLQEYAYLSTPGTQSITVTDTANPNLTGTQTGIVVVVLPVVPSVSISDVTITEGNTGTRPATFTVTLSASSSQPVTVNYATANVTATGAGDYQPTAGTLTFAPGQTSKTITVLVNGDRLGEQNEMFVVTLGGPTLATIADGTGVGTILDDEPRISISDVTRKEGKKGQTTPFVFTVTLSAAYDQPVTMSFRTVDGTARTSDSDYVAQASTLTFNPGETTKTITIVVNGDTKKESDETFYLDLFGNSSNSLCTKNRGIGTILNDD
jgi:hypothetical protein